MQSTEILEMSQLLVHFVALTLRNGSQNEFTIRTIQAADSRSMIPDTGTAWNELLTRLVITMTWNICI
ncbi:hypothetical protein GZ78_21245 [Endozoicomonas numazuensis]|uniref:Uncharacterized protein n=1 Tax=Endozoicomonas numazuensis TaxID=1137799 RepID=A0A081ND74_9GAMM|nr:hypothetical protein GZ78_21245 [Endozoicomonas numazuensis]